MIVCMLACASCFFGRKVDSLSIGCVDRWTDCVCLDASVEDVGRTIGWALGPNPRVE